MNAFTRSISHIFKGAFNGFQTFPASIVSALAFAIVTMIRIQLDWPEQEAYNFLFNCLHWSLALGAVFGLASLTAAQSRFNQPKMLKLANLLTALAVVFTFILLYTLGAADTDPLTARYEVLSTLAISRVNVAILISLFGFMLFAVKTEELSDFARSLFMTQKAFFIALIYGVVIMSGTSAVASAIENLLYHEMSEKVYMYIATIAWFLAFTIFVGYFPDFHKGVADNRREAVEKQPQFVEVLFGYIMVPIMLALTFVLLLWAGRTILTGDWPVFMELSSIATTYAIGGIWLHMMVTHHESGLTAFYRRFYPIAALVILAFQAQALLIQLGKSGLKTTEYFFVLLWLVTVISTILLLTYKTKAHTTIVLLICAVSFVSVLPLVGYHTLPVTVQTSRLENLLTEQGILKDGQLTPTVTEPDLPFRENVTDAVSFLAYAEDIKLPDWFDKSLSENDVFKTKLGFDQAWPKDSMDGSPRNYLGINLTLPSEPIDISGYEWALTLQDQYRQNKAMTSLATGKGTYQIDWIVESQSGIPRLKILLDDKVLIDEDMNAYLDRVMALHPLSSNPSISARVEDMSVKFENQNIDILIIFTNIDINVDPQNDEIHYWLSPYTLYLHEKP